MLFPPGVRLRLRPMPFADKRAAKSIAETGAVVGSFDRNHYPMAPVFGPPVPCGLDRGHPGQRGPVAGILAVGIFAYDVTDLGFLVALLALLGSSSGAVRVLLGALGDMMDSARLLRITMAVACLGLSGMTALFAMGIADYWHVAVSVFSRGFSGPRPAARRKLIGEIAGLNVSDAPWPQTRPPPTGPA